MAEAATTPAALDDLSLDEPLRDMLQALFDGQTMASIQGVSQDDIKAYYAVARSLYERERYEDARKLFTYLMALDHHETLYMGAVASCLQMLKRYDEAIEYYSLASVFNLDDPRPTFHTAECLLAQGRIAEAREALSIVLDDCGAPRYEAIRERAQALLGFIADKAGKATPGTAS